MDFGKSILLDDDHKFKVKLKGVTWEIQIRDKNILFDAICDLLLNHENLLFYASQKASCRTLDDLRKTIHEKAVNGDIKKFVFDVLVHLGWTPSKDINRKSDVFSGDIGELLMCILIDKLDISNTLISKVSLKTSPRMAAHQNDNIFYDFEKKVLYYGESKFIHPFIKPYIGQSKV